MNKLEIRVLGLLVMPTHEQTLLWINICSNPTSDSGFYSNTLMVQR